MNRVVITGFGAISPLGHTAETTWEGIVAGKSGVGPIVHFDPSDAPVKIAAEVRDFNPEEALDRKLARRLDRFQWFAHVAANEALEHSGLMQNGTDPKRVGIIISSGVGGLDTIIEQVLIHKEEGARRISPFAIPRIMANGAAGTISIEHGLRGPSFSVTSACASGSDGIGTALQILRSGAADAMVAGGSETGVSSFGVSCFYRIGAYSSKTHDTPSPFSGDRDGLVMGEGAGVLILETLDHAKKRGATIHAELIGYGGSSDAFHITAPTEDGSGSALAIELALKDAKINPEDIDYISAHGTGTPLNDASETLAVKLALGEQAYNIPMSSTKSMTGHMMGATGALEAVFCVQAIRDSIAPPTINYHEPDEVCDLDYVPNVAREMPIRIAISNAFGFGGHNSVLAFKRFEE
jgi:3-oxoacyl-[acyl-carrier-protein] synthase II